MALESYVVQAKPVENYQDLNRTISPEDVSKVRAIINELKRKDELIKNQEKTNSVLQSKKLELKDLVVQTYAAEGDKTNPKYIEDAINEYLLENSNVNKNLLYINTVKEMSKKTIKGISNVVSYFYFAPTFIRRNLNYKDIKGDGALIAHTGGINSLFLMAELLFLAVGNPIPLSLHLSTNAGSALYEWFRYEKNKLQNNIETKV